MKSIACFFSFFMLQAIVAQNNTNTEKKELKTTNTIENAAEPAKSKNLKSNVLDNNFSEGQIEMTYDQLYGLFTSKWLAYHRNIYRRSLSDPERDELSEYLNKMSALESKKWETSFAYYLLGQHDTQRYEALKTANKQNSSHVEIQKQLYAYYSIIEKTDEERERIVQLLKASIFTIQTVDYGRDVLASCENKATLITHGWEDFLSIRFAQLVQNYRTDVQVIQMEFLNSSHYQKQLKSKGYKLPTLAQINVAYISNFCALNENRKIQLSLTVAKPYLQTLSNKLYIRGVTAYYSSTPLDWYTTNAQLWEKGMNKQLLVSKSNTLSVNYLPMLYQLRRESNGNSYGLDLTDPISKMISEIVESQNLPASSKSY